MTYAGKSLSRKQVRRQQAEESTPKTPAEILARLDREGHAAVKERAKIARKLRME